MKLDHLADTSAGPLLRLYNFTPADATALHAALQDLTLGNVPQVAVHELPFIEPQAECRLLFVCGTRDRGVRACGRSGDFVCELATDSWNNTAGRVEPFAAGASGFQWLTDGPGDATILLSSSGRW